MESEDESNISEIRLRQNKVRRIAENANAKATTPGRQKPRDTRPPPTTGRRSNARVSSSHTPPKQSENEMQVARGFPPLKNGARVQNPLRTPVPIGGSTSAFDSLAIELENALGGFRVGWRKSRSGDRVALLAIFAMIIGVFLPWVSDGQKAYDIGLFRGGVVHFLIALKSFQIVLKTGATFKNEVASGSKEAKRGALHLVLMGTLSTLACIFFLLFYTFQRKAGAPVNLHFGLYWTLVFGTGLTYGGYSRFRHKS